MVVQCIIDLYSDSSNTYIIYDENLNGIVIDPGFHKGQIVKFVDENNIKLKAVLLTHAHYDHIRDAKDITNLYGVDIYISNVDIDYVDDIKYNASYLFGESFKLNCPCKRFFEGETLHLINEPIQCFLVPFHTKGSSIFYLKNSHLLFTGDSLFKGMIGRSDLIGGDASKIDESLIKIISLDKKASCYPGHGQTTSIIYELEHNMFVKKALKNNSKEKKNHD